jgi:hypothetical protein
VSPRVLRRHGELRLTANAAQLSLRDLRLRPLRPVVQEPPSANEPSPLETALLDYLDSLP